MDERRKALDEFLGYLKENFEGRIDKVYLFGSYARGGDLVPPHHLK